MKSMKFLKIFIYPFLFVLFCPFFTGCEKDNYKAPDCTIEGKILDHQNQPFQINHGADILRIREISWAKNEETFIGNRRLYVQQDGTYRHTKMFKGTYRLFPYDGAHFPYDDVNKDNDDSGDIVEINGSVTKDFVVTPFLNIEWVTKPFVDAAGYLNCSVKFTRNQKSGYQMPNLRRARLLVSRTVNAGAADTDLFNSYTNLTNDQEGAVIEFKTVRPLKYTGINYWVRIWISCQGVSDYPGIAKESANYTTVEQIFVP